jgi:hypothetical protein
VPPVPSPAGIDSQFAGNGAGGTVRWKKYEAVHGAFRAFFTLVQRAMLADNAPQAGPLNMETLQQAEKCSRFGFLF